MGYRGVKHSKETDNNMAKGLGNLKRFIKRTPSRTSPSWSPSRESLGKLSPDERKQTTQQRDEINIIPTSSDTVALSNPIVEIKNYDPVLSNADLSADDILDGILKDLNIKRISNEAKELETLPEYTGGSAKSIVDEKLADDDHDSDNEETSDEGAAAVSKGQSSTDARVAVVLSAAEEIRKTRGTTPPLPVDEIRKKRGTTPPVPVDSDESSGSTDSSAAVLETAPASNKEQNVKSRNPTLSPPIDPKVSPHVVRVSSYTGEDFLTDKVTMDIDTYDSTYDEDETIYTDGTEGTGGVHGSNQGDEVIDYNSVIIKGGSRAPGPPTTKKATMNMDVVTAHPGDYHYLAVRAMYCTPLLGNPDDIIIKVEVSFC
jgi:hypothetical protein